MGGSGSRQKKSRERFGCGLGDMLRKGAAQLVALFSSFANDGENCYADRDYRHGGGDCGFVYALV